MDTSTNQKLEASILRFNFTDEIMDIITQFAKMHQFDDRHVYRENWDKWLEENNSLLLEENERLREIGYEGDVSTKMYKAGRYYFRKKNNNVHTDNKDKEKEKRTYISMDKVIIDEMDKHIGASIGKASIGKASIGRASIGKASIGRASIGKASIGRASIGRQADYTPANGYKEFCNLHENLLGIEQKRLLLEYNIPKENIIDKFKKTYKNRYFILTR
jgi:hypothetical protein